MDWTKFIQKPEDKEGISWTDFIRPDDEDRDYAAELRRIRGIAEPPEEAPDISFTDIMRGALAFPQRAGHEAARVIMGMGGPEAADEWFGAEHRQPPTTGWEAADITADILGELTGHVTGLKMIGGVTRPAVSLLGRGITTAAPTLTRTLQPFTAPLAPGVPFATTMAARTGVEHLAGEEKEAVDYLASAAWGFGAGVTSPLASKLIRDMPTQFKGNPYAAAETVLSGAAAGLGGEVAQSIATGEVSSPGDIGMSMAMMALFNLSSIITNPAQKAAVIGARDKVLRDRAAYDEWLRIIGASRKDSQQDIFRKEREFWKAQEQRYDAEKAEQARKLEAHMKEMIKKYIDLPPDATDRQIKNALYKTFHPDIARDKPSFTDFGRAIKVAKQVIRATPMPEGAKKTAEQMVTKSQKTLFPSLTHGARPVISVGDDGKVRVTGFGEDVRSPRDIDLAKVPTVYEETPAITGDRPTTAEERQLQKDMVRDAGIKYIADQLRTAERATFTTDVSLEPDMHGKVRRIGEFEFSRSDEGKPFKVISYDYETGEPVPRIRHKFDRLEQVAEFIHYLTPHPSYKEVKELETAPREVEPFTVPKDKVLNQLEGIIENWKATGIEKISPDDPRKGAAEERQVYDQLKSLVRKLKDPRVAAEYIGPKEEYLKLRGDLERFTIGTAEKFVENLVARQKTPEEVAADQIREEREAIAEPEPTPAPEPTPEPVAEPVLTVETKDDTFELKVGDWVQLPDRAAPVKVVDDTDTATLSLETEHGAVMKRGRGALEGAQKIEEPPAEPAAPEPVEDPPATKEAPGPEDAPAPGPLEQRVHQEITEKDTELADYMVQRAMDWLGKEPLSKLQEAGPDDDIIGEVNAPLLINKIGIAATGTTQLNKAREAGVMRLMLEKGDITQEEWDDYLSGLGLKEPEKEKFIQRRVDAEAFERTMKHFGYESLYDKERAEQKRPMVAKSDFKLWEERYLEEVKKDEPFLKRLTDEWEGQVAETERARIIDESFGKEDWEVPQWVIVERSGGARNVVIERHQAEVKKALEEGKPVPQEVLEEYPDLVPEAPEPEVAPTKEPPAPEPAPPKPDIELDVKGKTSKAKAENIEIGTQFALVEADKLISSHDIMLREDPRFPEELQPRERTERMATEAQMYEIIQKLDPERLGENIIAAHGSPIIGKDGIVETGNIRTISLKRLYNDEHPNATRYRQWLSENAEQFGLSKDQLDKMEKPILVRVRTSELSSEERVNFVRTANKEETAAMSATEQAMVDADRVDANLIRLFVPYEDGRIDHPANRDFITAFLNKVVGVAKKGEYIDKTGRISQAGIKRIQNAIFARAYRDPATLERLAEDPSSEIKNITTAMLNVAPRVIQLQEKIKKGLAYDLDLSPEMKEAAKKVLHMKAENLTLDEFLKKKSLFDEGRTDPLVADILIMMDNFKRSAKKMTKVFNNYLGAMEKAPDPRQQTFIGLDKKFERQRPDRREVLRGAVYDVEGRKYDDPSLFDEKRAEAVRSEEHPKTDRDPTAGETTSPRFLRRRPTEEEAFKPEDRHKIIEEPIDPDAEPASARDIRKYITDEIGIYVGKKRLFTPGAEGEYRPFERVMRVKDTTDLHTIAHEFGHDVRKYLNLNLEKHRAELIQAFARSDLDETKYKPEELPYEGAAEVVKAYLLKGRTGAIEMAPSFTFHIEDQMTKDKEFEEKFEGLVDLYQRFRTQNAKEYLRGFLVSGFKKKEPQLTTKAERLYFYWWDDLMFLYKIPSEVLGLDPRKLEMPMVENPYHLALSTRVLGPPLETMFSKWAYDPYYRDAGPPLKKILEPVKDYLSDGEKVGDFSLYIFAKAAQERQELGIRVGPDQAALNKVVAEIEAEHPDWIEVNKQLQDFKKLLLDWAVWGDLIAPGAKKRMTDKYEWHMPLYVFLGEEQPITQLTAGNRFVNLPESFKRAIGTNAERLDPIESIVKDFVYIMNNVYRNKSALKFLDTLYKSPELGKMGHKLPKPTVVDEVSLKALKGDLKKAGLTDEELEELDLDTMVKTYSKVHYARMKEHRENIVTVRRKGEVEFWQVHPEIYDTLMSIGSRPETSQIIDKLVAPFTKLFAKGSLLSPTFSLVRNPVRDAVIGFTHGGDLGVKPFVDLARGITLIAKKDHKVDLFNAAKGARSGISRIISQADEFTVDKLMKEPGIGEKVNPVKFLETLLSSVEHGSRIGYFAKRIDQVDKDSLTKEEWQEHVLRAAAEARGFINQDYAIKGKWASKADKVSPFFTSTVGGPRTTYEAIRRDPWGHAWRTFVSLTLPSMILYLFNRNDPRYQELEQWKKDYFWTFLTPNGMFHLVKPFLPGLLFASGPERVMQAIDEQDPSVLTEWAKNVVKFGGPGWVIPLLMPTMEYLANHSFFTGRSIVPRSEEYLMPADQYGPGSSLAARVIGARTNLSPRKLDQFTRSLGSTLSTNILDTIDLIAGEMPLSEYAASLAGSRQTDYAGARSVDEFYDELRELETIENTIQLRHVRGQPIGDLQLDRQRLDLLRRYNDRMTTIRGRIRDIQNDPNLDDTIKERHLEELRLMMVNLAREAMGRELIQP